MNVYYHVKFKLCITSGSNVYRGVQNFTFFNKNCFLLLFDSFMQNYLFLRRTSARLNKHYLLAKKMQHAKGNEIS